MIDCNCGKTFLNSREQKNHAIERIVLYGENREEHRIDNDGPSVTYVHETSATG